MSTIIELETVENGSYLCKQSNNALTGTCPFLSPNVEVAKEVQFVNILVPVACSHPPFRGSC